MTQDNDTDVILMDVQMPAWTAWKHGGNPRPREGKGRVPIIAMTAYAMKGDREPVS